MQAVVGLYKVNGRDGWLGRCMMPENEFPKLVQHPFRVGNDAARDVMGVCPESKAARTAVPAYAELCVTSNYTFLTGASHPEELVERAALLGYREIALTDLHSLAGIVRAHVAAKQHGIRLVVGSKLQLQDVPGWSLWVYPTDLASYKRMCRMLTVGKRRAAKGSCHLNLIDLSEHARGFVAIASPSDGMANTPATLARIRDTFDPDALSLALTHHYAHEDQAHEHTRVALARRAGVPLVATNDVLYHSPQRRMLQDVLTCIRLGCTLSEAGYALQANAERHLRQPDEVHRLYAEQPEAIQRSLAIAERTSGFSMDLIRYEYPDEVVPQGSTPQSHLECLTWEGAEARYPSGVPEKVVRQIRHELTLIAELNYAPYFLTVEDIVRFARSLTPPILCQGRGAAANSAVCYCLGVTAVDPDRISVLFERFISKERNEPPDIDIDFEHERREEVIQYIYRKYGRERAALTAEVISYRRRSAVRDVGKALGLSLDLVDRLAKDSDWWHEGGIEPKTLRAMGLNPSDPTLQWLARLTSEILGFPRHLSQHVGGFVITRTPLCELVPLENAAMPDRTVIEWDKDDIDAMGMLKVDVLGLGMLTAIRKCLDMVNASRERTGEHTLQLHTIPPEDPATYEMIQRADTVGVFQIESRAQMSMLPRLKPACFYDLVIEVAIVRPGPIQGDMVHPYLRRRRGEEAVTYPNEAVKQVLGRTLGVPLFQEQAMQMAIVAAGFTAGEADSLRRAMAAWKRKGDLIYRFGTKLIAGMLERGYTKEFAERCFEQIKGFSEYGFPESHAASFALLVYVSCWLKRHYPAEFAAAIINSQPMGFYAPAQLVRDAREHGVEVRTVDVSHSDWDCVIEYDVHDGQLYKAMRLGMRLVSGVSKPQTDLIVQAAQQLQTTHCQAVTMLALWRSSGASAATFRKLAHADAFGSLGLSRQQALWQAKLLRDEHLPLFEFVKDDDAPATLPHVDPQRQTTLDYNTVGLSLKAHPMSFLRDELTRHRVTPCSQLQSESATPHGSLIRVAGLVLVRQRPGTASGVVFITLEDETGIANLILWSNTYEKYRKVARHSTMLIAHGRVQREGLVVHVHVSRLTTPKTTTSVRAQSRDFH